MKVIGLTGGIATGKSSVSTILTTHDLPIIDADNVAHQVLEPSNSRIFSAYPAVVAAFGPSILVDCDDDDTKLRPIDRKKLGAIVFNDDAKRRKHARLMQVPMIVAFVKSFLYHFVIGSRVVILDAPLLIESKMNRICSTVVVVTVDPAIQLERLMQRDVAGKDDAAARIKAQPLSLAEKEAHADIVLGNYGSPDDLRDKITRHLLPELNKTTISMFLSLPTLLIIVAVAKMLTQGLNDSTQLISCVVLLSTILVAPFSFVLKPSVQFVSGVVAASVIVEPPVVMMTVVLLLGYLLYPLVSPNVVFTHNKRKETPPTTNTTTTTTTTTNNNNNNDDYHNSRNTDNSSLNPTTTIGNSNSSNDNNTTTTTTSSSDNCNNTTNNNTTTTSHALFAGSFNPIHVGHLELLRYVASKHDRLFVVIATNHDKKYKVDAQERNRIVEKACMADPCLAQKAVVVTLSHSEYVWRFALRNNVEVMYRGIRTWEKDGRAEMFLHGLNLLAPLAIDGRLGPKTTFVQCSAQFAHISSTLVRANVVKKLSIHNLVPASIESLVTQLYSENSFETNKKQGLLFKT